MKIKYFIVAIFSSCISYSFATDIDNRKNETYHVPQYKVSNGNEIEAHNLSKKINIRFESNSELLAAEKALSKNISQEDIIEGLKEYRETVANYDFLQHKPDFEILKGGYIAINNGL